MNFEQLVEKASSLVCFGPSFLAAGEDIENVRVQVSRWVDTGRLLRIAKGLYTLAEPWRKVAADPFVIANTLKTPSYVSLQSALSYYGMIPEFVPVITSITTARPGTIETPLGRYDYRHVKKPLFWGYTTAEADAGGQIFMASPEKALLDLFWLTKGSDSPGFIDELRLQNTAQIDREQLRVYFRREEKPKLIRALKHLERMLDEEEDTANA